MYYTAVDKNILEMFWGLELEKNLQPLYSMEIKRNEKKRRGNAVIKSLIPGNPEWSVLCKIFIKDECHSMNNLHVLCKMFITDECHSMNSLLVAFFE